MAAFFLRLYQKYQKYNRRKTFSLTIVFRYVIKLQAQNKTLKAKPITREPGGIRGVVRVYFSRDEEKHVVRPRQQVYNSNIPFSWSGKRARHKYIYLAKKALLAGSLGKKRY